MLAAGLLILLGGCGLQQVQPKSNSQPTPVIPTPTPVPTVVIQPSGATAAAVVNGTPIPMKTFSDLLHYILKASSQQGQTVTPANAARQTMQELVQNAIIRQEAAKRHVTVPASDVDKQVATFVKNIGGAAGLKAQGLTKSDLRYVVEPGLLSRKLTPVVFPLRKSGPVVTARQILVQAKEPPPQSAVLQLFQPSRPVTKDKCTGKVLTDSQAHAEAQSLLAKLQKGSSFFNLAGKCSDDPTSGPSGGKLSASINGNKLYPAAEGFVTPFDHALFSAPVGKPTLVHSQFGWHIVEVLTRKQEKYTPVVSNDIQQGQFQAWLVTLSEHSNTRIIERVK